MFLKRQDPYVLVVGMTAAKMGDRLLQLGCAHGGRLAAVASKVGLSGRALAVVPDEASAARAQKGAVDAGVLVDVEIAPPTRLPCEDASFDLAVIDDTAGLLGSLTIDDRVTSIREISRVLRPGGRVILMGSTQRGGLGKLFAGAARPSVVGSDDANRALQANGFSSVRTLAEREGLVFVEAVRLRAPGAAG
jgi:ubiquinone/menaquinone biosynthesis C-methylase UbiE